MQFRINFGNIIRDSDIPDQSLNLIYKDNNLEVLANEGKVQKFDSKQKTIICIGNIIGKLDSAGKINPIESFESFTSKQIDSKNLFEIVNQLEGRFIIISIELNGESQICADRFSKLDIFIQKNYNGGTLASDLSLFPENPSKDGYDQSALAHMLTYYGYCPPKKHTIYKSISRLGVGEIAIINRNKLSIKEQDFVPINSSDFKDADQKKYTKIFLDYLKTRGSSKGNVVYLSSGWDSTSILAGLVHIYGASKVRAVTGRMKYSNRSGICNQPEVDKVQKITKYFGVKLDFVDFEFVDDAGINFTNGLIPLMKNHQIYSLTSHTHGKLAQKTFNIAKNDEVVFAGEISDGAHNLGFSQYATVFHPSFGFREYSDKMASYLFGPTFFKLLIENKHLEDPVYNFFVSKSNQDIFDELEVSNESKRMQLFTSFFLRNKRIPLWSAKNLKLLTPEGIIQYTNEMQDVYLKKASKSATQDNLYSWYMYLYNSFHWQGGTVRSLQVLADQYNLDTDLPFWQSNMQDFLSEMPEDWGRGLDLNSTKYPLKSMLKNDIDYPFEMQAGPHSYTYDIDHSFSHLEEIFVHSKFKLEIQKALSGKPYKEILSSKIFNINYIDSLVDQYLNDEYISIASLGDLAIIGVMCYVGWY